MVMQDIYTHTVCLQAFLEVLNSFLDLQGKNRSIQFY